MFSFIIYILMFVICTVLLIVSCVALLLCAPFDPARRVVHELSRCGVNIFFGLNPFWHRYLLGMENLDKSKSYVIVINHNSMSDIPTLYSLPLNFRWVSKREVFMLPFFGQLLLLHGDIAISRGNGAAAMAAVNAQGKVWLSRGASVAMFPEGTRSKSGEIGRFKSGAFNLAREAEVEILPVVLHGTRDLVKSNRLFSLRHDVYIKVLPPISVERVVGADRKELIEQVRESMVVALDELRNNK